MPAIYLADTIDEPSQAQCFGRWASASRGCFSSSHFAHQLSTTSSCESGALSVMSKFCSRESRWISRDATRPMLDGAAAEGSCGQSIPTFPTSCMSSVHCEISFLNYVRLADNSGLVDCNQVRVTLAYPWSRFAITHCLRHDESRPQPGHIDG